MIITPEELKKKIDTLTVIDVRPKNQQVNFPLVGLNSIKSENGAIPKVKGTNVLICQFGIVTEGIIIEKKLKNTLSLLGGAQAWNHYNNEQKDYSRWSHQTVLPELGIEGQNKLFNSKVTIVGMGGLGCPAAQSLLTIGVGNLNLIDGDIIALSNLHRQPLYGPNDVGLKKVIVAKKKLTSLNYDSKINITDTNLDDKNGMSLLSESDVIIDATDNSASRVLIDKLSKNTNIPMIYGGLYRWEGQVSVLNVNGSPGYTELFPNPKPGGETCEDAGILGMISGIIGNIQALEAVKLIVGVKNNLVGKLLIYDGMNHTTQIIDL